MGNLKNNKLQYAMSAVRAIFYDAIETRIRYTSQSYAKIAADLGCSEQTVFQLVRVRNLSRQGGTRSESSSASQEDGNVNQ